MKTILDVVYEHGVLKPIVPHNLKEHQHYWIVIEEIESKPTAVPNQTLLVSLPDGRKIARLSGAWSGVAPTLPTGHDPIADALADLRNERANRFGQETQTP